jgi:hypothetical protein
MEKIVELLVDLGIAKDDIIVEEDQVLFNFNFGVLYIGEDYIVEIDINESYLLASGIISDNFKLIAQIIDKVKELKDLEAFNPKDYKVQHILKDVSFYDFYDDVKLIQRRNTYAVEVKRLIPKHLLRTLEEKYDFFYNYTIEEQNSLDGKDIMMTCTLNLISKEELKCCVCGTEVSNEFECRKCGQLVCDNCTMTYNQFSQIDYTCCTNCGNVRDDD